jgi:hypothetical protein
MTWREQGFLSSGAYAFTQSARQQYSGWFEVADTLNRLAQDVIAALRVPKQDSQRLLGALLSVRLASAFQGCVILTERGMFTETNYVLRSLLEVVFTLAATAADPTFPRRNAYRTVAHQKKLAQALFRISGKDVVEMKIAPEVVQQKINEFTADIKEADVEELSVFEIAKIGGLVDLYESAYRLLSSSTHVLVSDLNVHVTADESGDIQKLSWGPNRDLIPENLYCACRYTLIGLERAVHLFELKQLQDAFDTCCRNVMDLGDPSSN